MKMQVREQGERRRGREGERERRGEGESRKGREETRERKEKWERGEKEDGEYNNSPTYSSLLITSTGQLTTLEEKQQDA